MAVALTSIDTSLPNRTFEMLFFRHFRPALNLNTKRINTKNCQVSIYTQMAIQIILAIKFIQSTISIHKKDPSNDESSLWSGRRGSNSRHPPWQGGILPLNYPRLFNSLNHHTCKKNFCKYFFCLSRNSILLCLYDQK